jgi:F-type H+-transporting ATPase subunit a
MVLGLEFPPVSHLVNWPEFAFEDTPFAFTKVTLVYVLAVILTFGLFFIAGRRAKLVPVGVQNATEASVDFVRESVIMQTMGSNGLGWLPFLVTMFFFIFFINIFEVIPVFQMPGNARIAVPLILAVTVWVIYNAVGIKAQGFFGYLKSSCVPPGVPKALLILVVPIEFVSTFLVRPFSLAIRLFANMLAGHFILVTFALLCVDLFAAKVTVILLPFTFGLLVALTGFEVLVAGLQAFIFAILTAVYIGGSMSPEH